MEAFEHVREHPDKHAALLVMEAARNNSMIKVFHGVLDLKHVRCHKGND